MAAAREVPVEAEGARQGTMRPSLLSLLACPACRHDLALGEAPTRDLSGEVLSGALRCPTGHTFPIHDGIPRFVPSENYARSFGFQWNRFDRTQLDQDLHVPLSETRF